MQFQQNQKVNITGGTVTVGSITGTVNVSGTVAISGGSVSISGTPNVNVTGGSITISSGSVTISSGVITSITNNVNVNAPVDILINTGHQFTAVNQQWTTTATATSGVEQILVEINSTQAATFNVQVSNTTNNILSANYNFTTAGVTTGNVKAMVPVAADQGDTIQVVVQLTAGTTLPLNINMGVCGLGSGYAVQSTPGIPINVAMLGGLQKTTQTLAAAGTVALLAAPPPNMAYALKRGVFAGAGVSTAGASQKIVGHTSGIRCMDFNCVTAAGIVPSHEDLGGILYAEGVDFVCTVAGATCDLHYDIVSIPVIQ